MTPQPESGGDTGNNEEGGSLIFVSDASAEAERLTTALRGRGYSVIDVPLALLVSRVSVQRPALILCDADAGPALETIQRVRELPGGNRIDVLFLGEPGRAVDDQAGALQQEASGVFVRPVEEFILLRKVEALLGAPSGRLDFPSRVSPAHRAPVLVAATRRPYRYDGGTSDPPRESPSSPAASARSHPFTTTNLGTEPPVTTSAWTEPSPDSQPRSSRPSWANPSGSARSRDLPQATLSPALESLLANAERRVRSLRNSSVPPSDRLSPEAELEAILPADVLDALDEPLDFDDDEDDADSSIGAHHGAELDPGSRSGTKSTSGGSANEGTVFASAAADAPALAGREKTADPGGGDDVPSSHAPESQSAPRTEPPITPPRPARWQSERPRPSTFDELGASSPPSSLGATTAHGPTTERPPSLAPSSDRAAALSTAPPRSPNAMAADYGAPPKPRRASPPLEIPTSLGPGDAVRAFARVVGGRYTGALAFEDATGIRRVLFRDGDFVTAASGAEGESLVAFLTQRGDLPSEVALRLTRKLPQFGRHAGAALIAQGHLRQDDLWPVLRAHAEWLVGRVALLERGAVSVEAEVPVRLQAEPAVFGGATGAEVLVEIVRRAVSPAQAIQRLGGTGAMLKKGEHPTLLGECAIGDAEAELVRSISVEPLAEVLRRAGHEDFAAVLYVLVELSVLGRANGEARARREPKRPTELDRLDRAALRARISARKALSEEGDYFALLGVARNATGYDIRRAYAALRDEYEPSRILSAETVDLGEDVELILEVLAEAFEILQDDLRRERYRRALDASP